jgi:glycine reductase
MGVLEVDRDQILKTVLQDSRITSARLELARPGDGVRITAVQDVLEPRIKTEGTGTVNPGICGRPVDNRGGGQDAPAVWRR